MICDSFSNSVQYVTAFVFQKRYVSFLLLQLNNLGYSERNVDIFKCLHLLHFTHKWLWKSCCCNQSGITYMKDTCNVFVLSLIFRWTEVRKLKIVTAWQSRIKCHLLVFNCERCVLMLKRKQFSFLGGATCIIDYFVQVVNFFCCNFHLFLRILWKQILES